MPGTAVGRRAGPPAPNLRLGHSRGWPRGIAYACVARPLPGWIAERGEERGTPGAACREIAGIAIPWPTGGYAKQSMRNNIASWASPQTQPQPRKEEGRGGE